MKKTTPKKTETRAERLRRLAPTVKAIWLELKEEEEKAAYGKKPLKTLWKEYQANLKKLQSYTPRIKGLDQDGLLGDLRKHFPQETYLSLFADRSGIGVPGSSIDEDMESAFDLSGLFGVGFYTHKLPLLSMDSKGEIYEEAYGNVLMSDSNVTVTYDVVKTQVDGCNAKLTDDDDARFTYLDLFIAVKKFANGIGKFLDRFEGLVDQMLDDLEAEAK